MPLSRFRVDAHGRGRDRTAVAALAGYAALAFLYLGVRLLVEPGRNYVGFRSDPKAFIWCFAWWPYAILHGQNPFVSHALWAPSGVNLLWTASVPGLALLFAPLTLLVGPVASYNVASLLLPALAAWTAFLLCRYLTNALWPSLLGGYLFGFSSYVLAQEGHPNISAVFLVPLIVLVTLRFVEGELEGRGLALRLGPLLGLEFLISTEIAFTVTIAGLVTLALGFALVPERRARLVELLGPLLAATVFAALLTAPFLYYALTGFQTSAFHDPGRYLTDALNFAVPTKVALSPFAWTGSTSRHFPGNYSEQDGYLGLPVLVIVALYARTRLRTASGRLLIAALLVAVVCCLGATLTVGGHRTVWLPWSLVGGLPLFDNVLPSRLALYVTLLAALIVALWTAARPPGVMRFLLPGLAALALLPNPDAGIWASRYTVPPFFTDAAFRDCLRPGEIVLPLPVSARGDSMLWQAEDGFRFRMAAGNIGARPPAAFLEPYWVELVAEGYPVPASQAGELSFYIGAKHVTSVVVDAVDASLWSGALDRIATPERVGGVILYHTAGRARPCLAG